MDVVDLVHVFGLGAVVAALLADAAWRAPLRSLAPSRRGARPLARGARARPRPGPGVRCPFCRSDFRPGERRGRCHHCGTPHHPECFVAHGRCTVYGCPSVDLEPPRAEDGAAGGDGTELLRALPVADPGPLADEAAELPASEAARPADDEAAAPPALAAEAEAPADDDAAAPPALAAEAEAPANDEAAEPPALPAEAEAPAQAPPPAGWIGGTEAAGASADAAEAHGGARGSSRRRAVLTRAVTGE
ncbi:MAG: hypothetical protein D6731_19045 [Planctomycetota bacterium]|nr:MAG: hypothetical protein D6731_19045 [Planctomycetota bacterium]